MRLDADDGVAILHSGDASDARDVGRMTQGHSVRAMCAVHAFVAFFSTTRKDTATSNAETQRFVPVCGCDSGGCVVTAGADDLAGAPPCRLEEEISMGTTFAFATVCGLLGMVPALVMPARGAVEADDVAEENDDELLDGSDAILATEEDDGSDEEDGDVGTSDDATEDGLLEVPPARMRISPVMEGDVFEMYVYVPGAASRGKTREYSSWGKMALVSNVSVDPSRNESD